MKKRLTLFFIWFCCSFIPYMTISSFSQNWDIINKEMATWNVNDGSDTNKAWGLTKTYLTATQHNGYINIKKTSGADGFITPTAYPTTNKTKTYTIDIKARINATGVAETKTAFEANQISICIEGKKMQFFLKHGSNGYLCYRAAATHDEDEKYTMNTSGWHTYRFVYFPETYTYNVYVDESDEPVFSGIKTHYDGSKSYVMIGSDKDQFCNMDIEYVKFGTGNFALKTQLRNIEVSSDSHIAGNQRSINLTVNTDLIANGQKVYAALFDEYNMEAVAPVELQVSENKAVSSFSIPATLAIGKYNIKAFVENNKIDTINVKPVSIDYFIVDESPITSKILPQIKTEDFRFIIKLEDYIHRPISNEFIFPSVIDTKHYTGMDGKFLNGELPLDRYYWFHAPHDDPGGIYLYTAPSLDGTWIERGVILSNDWAKAQGINTSHISSSHVMWNSLHNKYFMYFHGNNDRTHYATSDNLIDWTYGAQVVQYDDFSFSSREASYARVFEYEVPGYNNKYVMLLMINENTYRTIYWAHSTDGITWKGVRKPLISPTLSYKKVPGTDTKPSYKNNVSGPFFMEANGRYFVLFHSTEGNISVVEIGEKFDMEVHWGTYLNKSALKINEDESGGLSAVSRVASPFFIQDDNNAWYLFVEAGHRLGANTAYSKSESYPNYINEAVNTKEKAVLFYRQGDIYTLENKTREPGTFNIFNLTGQLIKQGEFSPGKNSIGIEKGIYLIQVKIDNDTYILKSY